MTDHTTGKRQGRPLRGNEPPGRTPMRAIRVSDEDWDSWKEAAERVGLSLSAWLRQVAGRAAKH